MPKAATVDSRPLPGDLGYIQMARIFYRMSDADRLQVARRFGELAGEMARDDIGTAPQLPDGLVTRRRGHLALIVT